MCVRPRIAARSIPAEVAVNSEQTGRSGRGSDEPGKKLAAVREASAKRIPPDRLAVMHDATERLRNSGIMDRMIKPGAKAPDFTLENQEGQRVSLSAKLAEGPVVLGVFRGFW
jgi:hypothetical protein